MSCIRALVAAVPIALFATSSFAGSFVELPNSGSLRKFGAQNLAVDQFFINPGPVESTVGGINTYGPPAGLTLLTSRDTTVVLDGEDIGTFSDFVFRDSSDNRLVFGGRLALTDVDAEINDIFRGGFTGYSAATAWTFRTDLDLRLFSAARTNTGLLQGADVFNPDVVNMRSDINVSEGNPNTGWYFIKTNAPFYALGDDVIRFRQAGEEGQPVVQSIIDGFVPSAIPEPHEYAMLLAGLAMLALVAKRKHKSVFSI